jgi:hypothetical protein
MRVSLGGSLVPFETEVPSVWETVRKIRETISQRLEAVPPALRDAIVIVASELSENVLKYSSEGGRPPVLSVELSNDRVVVRTENDVRDVTIADRVLTIVERIGAHADPVRLYAEAIEARLASGALGATQQGFYRIAAVGEFRLEARREGNRLFIFAERMIR